MNIPDRIVYYMKQRDVSIRQLSDLTGIPRSALQRYTSGTTEKIPVDRLEKIASVLSVDAAAFFGWEDRPASESITIDDRRILIDSITELLADLPTAKLESLLQSLRVLLDSDS